MKNERLKFLTLASNNIKADGLEDLVKLLKHNTTLQELSLGANKITNEGIIILSHFLEMNKTLHFLDISRNVFTDSGFEHFARAMALNEGLTLLDISKNKELNDDGSLIVLANSLTKNKTLNTLDLSGVRIRKPYLKLHLEPALR